MEALHRADAVLSDHEAEGEGLPRLDQASDKELLPEKDYNFFDQMTTAYYAERLEDTRHQPRDGRFARAWLAVEDLVQ